MFLFIAEIGLGIVIGCILTILVVLYVENNITLW